jgi:hypothetical protein
MKKTYSLLTLLSLLLLVAFISGCKKDKKDPAKLPTVSTLEVTGVNNNSAVSSSDITSDGGAAITTRGFCWSTKPMPIPADNKTEAGSGTGTFKGNITGFKQGTAYYVRAYATNTAGTAFSNQVIISTNTTDSDGNIYHTIAIGTQLWMVENLKITHYRNGEAISDVQNNTTWESTFTLTGAYCDYNNDVNMGKVYGHLYNYASIKDPRNVCPEGWRLPTGGFASIGQSTGFWSDPSETYTRALLYDGNNIAGTGNTSSVLGVGIRCIKE